MSPIQQERQKLAASLRKAATAHEQKRFTEIAQIFEYSYAEFAQTKKTVAFMQELDRETEDLFAGVWEFWRGWWDEVEHNFRGYYSGITRRDWPRLARALAESLETNQPIHTIRNPNLLRFFVKDHAVHEAALKQTAQRNRAGGVGLLITAAAFFLTRGDFVVVLASVLLGTAILLFPQIVSQRRDL
jgi:hypothetical protein